jgi:dTMP kinase
MRCGTQWIQGRVFIGGQVTGSRKPTNGLFIVFEGIDGSGKTTQTHLLDKSMRRMGRGTWLTAEPSNGPVGQLIRKVLTHEAKIADSAMLHLFTADRMDHVKRITKKRGVGDVSFGSGLGIDVICDRYLLSTLVYQGGDDERRHATIFEMNRHCPLPDLLFFIRTDLDTALARMSWRSPEGQRGRPDLYEGKDRLATAYRQYNTCVARYSSQLAVDSNVVILDGNKSIPEIADTAKFHVLELIRERNRQPLDAENTTQT